MYKIISGIYLIINNVNNKIYVGSSVNINKRKNRHYSELKNGLHKNKHLQNAWNLYGEENFTFNIIQYNINKSDLIKLEQHYIDKYNSYDREHGYNICPVAYSTTNYKHGDEIKKEMSISRKLNGWKYVKCGDEHWNWGNKLTVNAKNYFRDSHPDYNGENSPNAKLTKGDVIEIRVLYETEEYTYKDLGEKFHVNKRTIGKIVNRERWKNI
jgi:group I intron endonuclease